VTIKDPQYLQEFETFRTRNDGSFTLHALVTDVGTETIEIIWNETYAITLPLKLPSTPEQVQLKEVVLPINFITVNIQDIYGKNINNASVSFQEKQQHIDEHVSPVLSAQEYSEYPGKEAAAGIYESPALPDNTYIIVVRKEGYIQEEYSDIPLEAGVNKSDVTLTLPHLLTVTGTVTNGKGAGITGVETDFSERNSRRSTSYSRTDASGYFSEQLLITSPGKDTLTLRKQGEIAPFTPQFERVVEFTPQTYPGEQQFNEIRLPINFIPIRVLNVAEQEIDDASVLLAPLSSTTASTANSQPLSYAPATNLGKGRYEGSDLKDGTYQLHVWKKGYESQERTIEVLGGEVVPEAVFILPHYVVVKGLLTEGKGNGVSDAVLEFNPQNSKVISDHTSPSGEIKTNLYGQFSAKLLVKLSGIQRVKAIWNGTFVKQFFFTLPEQPNENYHLEDEIRLPINSSPFLVSNVLGEGMAGVDIQLKKIGDNPLSENVLSAETLGGGHYEAQNLPDGTYSMKIHKDGYQDVSGNFSVNGGEQTPEHVISLPHYVSVQGTIVNGNGVGIAGAEITASGSNSQPVRPDESITTASDGSFQLELLVIGSEDSALQEQLEVSWDNADSTVDSSETIHFSISHNFFLPNSPRIVNLGLLHLPANFFSVIVRDIAGKGLTGVHVTFTDEHARKFSAQELVGGVYEGQNLPDGTYTIMVEKDGYETSRKPGVSIISATQENFSLKTSLLTFQLPYFVRIEGTTVNGKGEALSSDVSMELAGMHSRLLPESVHFNDDGHFQATLLVHEPGREYITLNWKGEQEVHSLQVPFILPSAPQILDLRRLSLPINFIPIEVNDLLGHGIRGVTVTIYNTENGQAINAQGLGNGRYEGKNLSDGSYRISVAKDGYKSAEHPLTVLAGGIVSETKTFRLRHYVWLTGRAVNGKGEGVRDSVIDIEHLRSLDIIKQSDITGKFDVQLEVQDVGTERLYLTWKNMYRTPFVFNLPNKPIQKDLGDIRLPINFLSILVTDISGSMLPDAAVSVEDASGQIQPFKTDQNGFCNTYDLPNGTYRLTVEKSGYKTEYRDVQVRDGERVSVRFTLPHYMVITGSVKDIMNQAVGEADVIFEEFSDADGQTLKTQTDKTSGKFEQRLLIDDSAFLERQKGHFRIIKDNTQQRFTFKIPALPNQTLRYKTLLFPTTYLSGKVVNADVRTIPIHDAQISLEPVREQMAASSTASRSEDGAQETLHLTTDSLGMFQVRDLEQQEYKITIKKEGYVTHENFIRISGLLQEQEFALQKE